MAIIPLTPEQQEVMNRSLEKQQKEDAAKGAHRAIPAAASKADIKPEVVESVDTEPVVLDSSADLVNESSDSSSFKSYKKRK